jgi:hypothetical protein
LIAEFTKTVHGYWHVERLDLLLMDVLLMPAGKCSGGRAKSANLEGHLPPGEQAVLNSLSPG